MIANGNESAEKAIKHAKLRCNVAGAPPPESLLAKMEEMGFKITHVYSLTKSMARHLVSSAQNGIIWPSVNARKKSRQGMNSHLRGVWCIQTKAQPPVAADGNEIGACYPRQYGDERLSKNLQSHPQKPSLTVAGFKTGDLGVKYPMVASKLWINSKTSSSRAARISQVSK